MCVVTLWRSQLFLAVGCNQGSNANVFHYSATHKPRSPRVVNSLDKWKSDYLDSSPMYLCSEKNTC